MLISIIVPCFNQAEYLDDCLQSVIDQTYNEWECIIIDDGSSDNTSEIVKNWIKKDSRFRYYHKNNTGVADTRNFGVSLSRGEWLLPLDGDDKIGNEYLERASCHFLDGYEIIYCKAIYFGEKNGEWYLPDFSFERLLNDNMIFNCAFFKKEAFIKIEGYDKNLIYGIEDWEFWINLLKNSTFKKVMRLEYIGFYYRIKNHSRTSGIINNNKKLSTSLEYIYEKHKDEYAKYFGNYGKNLRIAKFYIEQRDKIEGRFISRILFKLILWLIK